MSDLIDALQNQRRVLFQEWRVSVSKTSRAYIRSEIDEYLALKDDELVLYDAMKQATVDFHAQVAIEEAAAKQGELALE